MVISTLLSNVTYADVIFGTENSEVAKNEEVVTEDEKEISEEKTLDENVTNDEYEITSEVDGIAFEDNKDEVEENFCVN